MKNQSRKSLVVCVAIQSVIAILYGVGLVRLGFLGFQNGKLLGILDVATKYLATFLVLVLSLIPQFSLLFKHKLHSLDGEILPTLFLIISFQASSIITEAVDAFGYVFYLNDYLLYFQRFALMATASLFLLAALRYYGYASSSMGKITMIFLAFPLLVATMVPLSSYHGVMELGSSWYEVYLLVGEAAIYLAAIITFILVAFKDGTTFNTKRTAAFILIIVGLYLTRIPNPYLALASVLLYIPGTIILTFTAGDTI